MEKRGEREKVFLANLGPVADYKPRADFASGFFEVGGFEVLTNNGFSSIEEAADAALQSGARTIVICSTDETYPDAVPALLDKLPSENYTIYLAGRPTGEELARYQQAGLEDAIHAKSNVYSVLEQLQKMKGVLADEEA